MLTKLCKQSTKSDNEELCQGLKAIQQSLKLVHIKLNELQAQLFSREFDLSSIVQMQEKINELHKICEINNDDLNALLTRFLQTNTECDQQTKDSPSQIDLANKEG